MTTAPAQVSFAPLQAAVREAGLLRPRTGYYILKFAANTALLAAAWALFGRLGDSWWQVAAAVLLAFAYGQTGLLGHDVGHAQVTRDRKAMTALGLVHGNLLLGFSYGWWMSHHTRHHNHPNHLDHDPDILRRVVAFSPRQAEGVSRLRALVIRHQAPLFFPLLNLEAVGLRVGSVIAIRRGIVRHPRAESLLLALHAVLYTTAVLCVLDPLRALVFVAVHQGLFGVYLGCVFAPNHKGMPVRDGDTEPDWLSRQVLTSRNIRSSRLHDFLFGGLNYQIEHHLFPTVPRPNLRRCRPLTMAHCAEMGLPYHEVSATRSYIEVLAHLRQVTDQVRRNAPRRG
ncbi:fatty acid desaturase family protein [Streptomyces sp. NRRL S-237]|uniref:fatty acid desaturase family protein n=1 Tax=Streptomyces sp. NRRL S-237 TaxID=1463895 RepID=UPI0004C50DC1|nr:acyl-CoA desaturase [Streptomyces sp. NRRL S-237]